MGGVTMHKLKCILLNMIKLGLIAVFLILALSFAIYIIEYTFGKITVLIIMAIFILLLLYNIASEEDLYD